MEGARKSAMPGRGASVLRPKGRRDHTRTARFLAGPAEAGQSGGMGFSYESWGWPAETGGSGGAVYRPQAHPGTALHFPLGPIHRGQQATSGSQVLAATLLEALWSQLRGQGLWKEDCSVGKDMC